MIMSQSTKTLPIWRVLTRFDSDVTKSAAWQGSDSGSRQRTEVKLPPSAVNTTMGDHLGILGAVSSRSVNCDVIVVLVLRMRR